MNKETRSFNFDIETRNDETKGDYIEGRAIVYNDCYDNGYFYEYIDEGALLNTDLKDVRLLVNHNTDMIPLARSRNNTKNSTMQLLQDEKGLAMRANLDTDNNEQAKSLYSAIKRGDISGMSFMFEVDKDEWEDLDTEKPTRHITSIKKVYEVSAVSFPAYEATELSARGDVLALDSVKAALDNAKAVKRAKDEAEERARVEIEKQKQRIKILAML